MHGTNYSDAQKRRWANMSSAERADMQKRMSAGRKKAKTKRRVSTKRGRKALSEQFQLADKLAEVYILAGGREQVIRLLDIVELVHEEDA